MILESICVALVAILLFRLLMMGLENSKKLQFFKEKSPNLPVMENPNLFFGNISSIVIRRNWSKVNDYIAKYGPTFGLYYGTKPAVITVDLDFIRSYLIDQPDVNDKIVTEVPMKELANDCIVSANGNQWTKLRRAIAPAFSSHRIKTQNVQAEIDGLIDRFVGSIEGRLNEAKAKRGESFIIEDADDICLRYSLGLVFTCFYKQPGAIDFESRVDKTVHMVRKGLVQFTKLNFVIRICVAFPFVTKIIDKLVYFGDQGTLRRKILAYLKEQAKRYFQAMKEMEAEAEFAGAKHGSPDEQAAAAGAASDRGSEQQEFTMGDGSKFKRNMIDYVNEQYRAGKLTRSEFFNNSFFLFFAANKTSSDAIAKVLHHLACHQAVQDKLRESIRADGVESEYLSWVVNESLRLFPPAPIGASRMMKRDMHTKHGLVPAGTFVITPAYTIHRLTEYWGQDANEFRPERWANAKSFHPCQYLVFGGGRRACPGKELALMETKMLLNVLLRKYKFEQCAQTDHEQLFESPMFVFLVFDRPSGIKISRL